MDNIYEKQDQVNDRQIWIKENHLYLDDNNIIYDIAKGDTDEDLASGIKEGILTLARKCHGTANLFVDLSYAGKPTPAARKIYLSITENEKIGKIALVGLNPVARVLASSLTSISGKRDLRFFKNKADAITWLKA